MQSQINNQWMIPGKQIWIRKNMRFIKAVIVHRDQTVKIIKAKISTGEVLETPFNDVFECTSNIKEYPDMCSMDILNEPQIMNNLKIRYNKDFIFTKIGPTLIVINPYKMIKPLFNEELLINLAHRVKNNQRIDNLEPHVYLVAGNAYNRLKISNKKQSLVISGESGAGKTQNAKYCMKFLAALSHQENVKHQHTNSIQDKILDCNPVLQAFGNSKTVRNSNSSRFGKYVKLFVDTSFTIIGAKIQSYLLEKSRVTSVASKERNFHVFYCLLSSQLRNEYGLMNNEKYQYLQQSQTFEAEGIDDKEDFKQINLAMKQIGFQKQQINKIWQTVSTILMLGNLKFDGKENHDDANKLCKFADISLAKRISKNLHIQMKDLEKLLLTKSLKTGKQIIYQKYNQSQCISNRNTLAKALYNRMFDFIIQKMNKSLNLKEETNSIGLLDIFGFQNFALNSFQQLCINFTNQKLQKLYTKYVFETQLDQIKKDGLGNKVKDIQPPDNKAVIQLIEKRKMGQSIFGIIDQKTSLGAANDEAMIADMRKFNHIHLTVNPSNANKTLFTIMHTQSTVTYNVDGFKNKNQDSVTNEIEQILQNAFSLSQMSQNKGKTLATKFDNQIKGLMDELQMSEVHFIRCIKPNQEKRADFFNQQYVLLQIKYLGVLETIKIRKSTFPFRKAFKAFNGDYIDLIKRQASFSKFKPNQLSLTIIKKIFPNIQKQKNSILVGNQRIYLSSQFQVKLNEIVLIKFKKRHQSAKKLQKQFKRFLQRKKILNSLKKIVLKVRKLKKFLHRTILRINKENFNHLKSQIQKAQIALKQKKRLEQKKKIQQQRKKMEQLKKKQQQQQKKKQEQQKRKKNLKNQEKINKSQTKIQKFDQIFKKKLQPIIFKYLKFNFITKLKYFNQSQEIDRTIIAEESMILQGLTDRSNTPSPKKKKEQIVQQNKFNQSFLNQKSILQTTGQGIALKGQLKVGKFIWHDGVKKLRDIIDQVYQNDVSNEQQFYSPASKDCHFNIKTINADILKKILNFNAYDFFDQILRKRTNIFGIKKLSSQTLVAKTSPITKSLIKLPQQEQKKAVQSFRILLKLSQQNKIQKVFKYIEQIIQLLQNSTQQLKNQIFCQFIKQQKGNSELAIIRVYQMMTIYLHIYAPQQNFIYAALNIFYSKLTSQDPTLKKQNQYLIYLFPRLLYHLQKGQTAQNSVSYMPAQYQLMALMCKRQISLPVFFSVGNSIIIRVQSNQTFDDIKQQVLKQVGINSKRLVKQFFGFFQIMNFENEQLQQSPIDDHRNVWDLLTYWQRAKQKFQQGNIKPPVFILMLKIKYVYQCDPSDLQSIQLFYAQCYFDLFIGRIRLDKEQIINSSSILKLMNIQKKQIDPFSLIPMWALQQYGQNDLMPKIQIKFKRLKQDRVPLSQLKFLFVKCCDTSKICMSMAIPTEQAIKMYIRPKKVLLAQKSIIHQQIPIKKILKWSVDLQSLMLCVQKQKSQTNKTIVIRTQHAQIVSKYLSQSAKLIMSNATRRNGSV